MKLQKIELLNYDLLYDILQKLKLKKYFYQINHILSIFNVNIDVMVSAKFSIPTGKQESIGNGWKTRR